MAISHASTVRTALATRIRDLIDGGPAAGRFRIFDSGSTLLADIPLNDPCGTVSGPTLTFNITPSVEDSAADATGTAATFTITDSTGQAVYSGTVTATGGGGDATLPSTAITAGEAIQITSASYTASL